MMLIGLIDLIVRFYYVPRTPSMLQPLLRSSPFCTCFVLQFCFECGISCGKRELWRNTKRNIKLYFRWETQSLTHHTTQYTLHTTLYTLQITQWIASSHMPFIKSSIWQREQYTIFSMQKQIEAKHLWHKNSFREEYRVGTLHTHGPQSTETW